MEKLVIIGGGIAGLAAGIYGRLNGFDTELYEKNAQTGGECIAWQRGGYTFDGCIHWLMGSKPGVPLNSIWRDTGALDDSVRILTPEVFYQVERGGTTVRIYRDLDRLERHLLEVAPEDADAIHQMCRDARSLKGFGMPDKPFEQMNALDGVKMGAKMLPYMGVLNRSGKVTVGEYAQRFRNPALRTAMESFMPSPYVMTGMLMTLASLHDGDSGFPEGGSLPLVQRMEKRYLDLGGKLLLRKPVREVLEENGRAVGVRLEDGSEARADWVISCADGYHTLHNLLGDRHWDETNRTLYGDGQTYPVYSTVQVSLGVACDLADQPGMAIVQAETPVDAGGIRHDFVSLKNYSFDPTMVPVGKTVITSLLGADYDWWKACRADTAAYRAEKQRVADEVIAVLNRRYPQTVGKVETVDVVTPTTYERYCNAWKGAWMSFMNTPGQKIRFVPGSLPGLERFQMAGQWVLPPGGLPGAVMSGKWAIERILASAKKAAVNS